MYSVSFFYVRNAHRRTGEKHVVATLGIESAFSWGEDSIRFEKDIHIMTRGENTQVVIWLRACHEKRLKRARSSLKRHTPFLLVW
jgi:hypothetical protein